MKKTTNLTSCDVLVCGGGASGMMAAIQAASGGAVVIVLDHQPAPGKKILSTGNGKCNFTNSRQEIPCYRSDDDSLVEKVLNAFSWRDTIHFFRALGVLSTERDGYYYPRSGQARTIRDALITEMDRRNIRVIGDTQIQSIQKENSFFFVNTKTETCKAGSVILATGGQAAPKTGSDGSGYLYAMSFGHTIDPPVPALVPLLSKERWLKQTAGVRCHASVELRIDQKPMAFDQGEVQLTDTGISGIPVFQISRYASRALAEKKLAEVHIDFLPEMDYVSLNLFLNEIASSQGTVKNWYQILSGLVNHKIAAMICSRAKLSEFPVLQLSGNTFQKQIRQAARLLKDTPVVITGTKRFEFAQVTSGGIFLSEIDASMQSRFVPGLFFAGEIMNVDGICGGYNLQWAFSSGAVAGRNAAFYARKKLIHNEKNDTSHTD